jgi:hypothetical protein
MSTNNTFKWAPWEEQVEMTINTKIPYKEPPCKHCDYWRPHKKYIPLQNGDLMYDGVCMCMGSDMEHDFSCFSPRRTDND